MIDYDTIRAEYIAGSMSVADLAAKHCAPPAALERRATREQWPDARRAVSSEVRRVADRGLVDAKGETLAELNAASLAIAKAVRDRVVDAFNVADRAGVVIPAASLLALARTAEAAQRIGRLALGASTDNSAIGGRVEVYTPGSDEDPVERIRRRMEQLRTAYLPNDGRGNGPS